MKHWLNNLFTLIALGGFLCGCSSSHYNGDAARTGALGGYDLGQRLGSVVRARHGADSNVVNLYSSSGALAGLLIGATFDFVSDTAGAFTLTNQSRRTIIDRAQLRQRQVEIDTLREEVVKRSKMN